MAKKSQGLSSEAQAAITTHSNHLKLSVIIGAVIGLFFYAHTYLYMGINPVPILGTTSLARPTIALAAMLIFVTFWYFFDRTNNRMLSPNRMGLIYNSFVLSLATTILGTAILAIFAVGMSEAFKGLEFDIYTSSVLVGASIAATIFVTAGMATTMTVRRVFTMLAVIMFGGIYITAVAVATPDWYNVYLSALGMESAGNVAKLFNFSLVFAGIMLIAMGNTLMQSVRGFYLNHPLVGKRRFEILYSLFVVAGILLAGIGAFPFVEGTAQGTIHILSAGLLGATFVLWMWGMKWLIPFFDQSFYAISYAAGASIAVIYILATMKIYFNVTGEELSVFIIATVWLSLLVTNMINATLDSSLAKG